MLWSWSKKLLLLDEHLQRIRDNFMPVTCTASFLNWRRNVPVALKNLSKSTVRRSAKMFLLIMECIEIRRSAPMTMKRFVGTWGYLLTPVVASSKKFFVSSLIKVYETAEKSFDNAKLRTIITERLATSGV